MRKYYIHDADYVCTDTSKWEQDAVETVVVPDCCADEAAIDAFQELGYDSQKYSLADEYGFQIYGAFTGKWRTIER